MADASSYQTLYEVCRSGDELEARRMVKAGADPHKQCTSIGVYPVHRAAESGNIALVRFFVEECHVAVDVRDFSGTTPLHYATYNGHEAITRYLVEVARADYHVENNDKLTLVHNAAFNGHLKTLRYLVLELGLPAEYRNKDSITPLHNSTFNGHRACSEFLLREIGVTPNVCNRSKLTPIRNSCANGHLMVTRLLASYGADYTMLDHTGANALSHASDKAKAKAAIALGFVDHVFNKRRFALMMWMSWNDSPWKVDNLAMSSSS